MVPEFAEAFKKIHYYRTGGLHRLVDVPKEEIAATAVQVFVYFQYFDEFCESQTETHEMLHSQLYPRLRYGEETWLGPDGNPMIYVTSDGEEIGPKESAERHPCHDCAAVKGQYHCSGCDVEECPRCHGQFLSCECRTDEDIEYYEKLEEQEDSELSQ